MPRLPARSAEGEVLLASFQWTASTDPLDEHPLAAVAAGMSTRRYASTLDPVPAEMNERATSSSAVSRRFVALSTKRLHAFLSRPLGELDLRVVCIDGKVFRDHCMVIALGIDTQGRKHVLGVREGATETAAATIGLLSDLVTRGLPTDRTLLFVVDGASGVTSGHPRTCSVLGAWCNVAKCISAKRAQPFSRAAARVLSARRCGMRGISIRRTARTGKKVGGRLRRNGRFCRASGRPATAPHGQSGCLQVAAGGLAPDPGGLFDPPQRPAEAPQRENLLSFLFLQDVAHAGQERRVPGRRQRLGLLSEMAGFQPPTNGRDLGAHRGCLKPTKANISGVPVPRQRRASRPA